MTYLVIDNATNNVLGEFESFTSADQWRIQVVGANPPLAPYIEVVNIEDAVAEYEAPGQRVADL